MGVLSPSCSVFYVTTYHDIPADLLNPALGQRLTTLDSIQMPDWAAYVKTGVHTERPPISKDWWAMRCAALLRKVARNGPIGVNHLSQNYGGRKATRSTPARPAAASRKIIRVALQQLENSGLVAKADLKVVASEDGDQKLYSGRICTSAGQKLLDEVAHSLKEEAEKSYPGLSKY